MSRPAGEPGVLGAGARSIGGAAAALRDVGGQLGRATSLVVVAGAWRGPASEAFLIDGAGLQTSLDRAADTLGRVAGAVAELPGGWSTPRRPGTGPSGWPPRSGSSWARTVAFCCPAAPSTRP